ncbi:MAG: hypothetical protein IJ001_07365 [Oscillospiraceae bacterium]|nr:hypothetical protein [Oscillospiraceae bacterium]
MKTTFRTSILFLLILSLLLPLPAHAEEVSLDELFRQAVESTETETLPMRLHDAFYADTDGFIALLAQEDMLVQESVCRMVAQHSGGSGEYIQYVLSLLPEYSPQERGSTLFLLLNVKADLSNAPDDFSQTLFTALEYSDGALTTRCYSLMADLLETDPFGLVADIVQEDAHFQDSAVTILALENYCWDGLTMDDAFHQSLAVLNKSENLTEPERSFVDRLTAEVARLEQEAEAYRIAATETTVPPEPTNPAMPTGTTPSPTETPEVVTTVSEETDYTPILIAAVCVAMLAVVIAASKKHGV